MTASVVDREKPPYLDPARGIDERVEDLLARMTLEDKIAQLGSCWVFELADSHGALTAKSIELLRYGVGQVTRISGASSFGAGQAAEVANMIQRHLVENTRLRIPAIVHEEICSGLMARDATGFPQAIGIASTWEPRLIEAVGDAIRKEMRARGAHHGLGPVLDICRDPRWGRLEETFGEDPHVVAQIGLAFIQGLQGDDLLSGVVATAKHFVGYGASEGGKNWAPAQIPPRELNDVYLHPFEAAVRVGSVRAIMSAYNEVDGLPCVADRDLLTELLRRNWKFAGCVVSDYFSIRQLADYHRFAVDAQDAARMTLSAGVDVELPSTDCYGPPLLAAVTEGSVAADLVDEAVRRVLRTKFELGLFEAPFVDAAEAGAAATSVAHRQLAANVARKSLVLLRNDGTLPLAREAGTVAVIGPCADEARNLFGDYAYPAHVESLRAALESGGDPFTYPSTDGYELDSAIDAMSVRAALRAHLGTRVRFARGCDVNSSSREGFDEAIAVAREADVAIMVMGDKSGLTDDCTSGETRDRSSLDLPGVQEDLVAAVAATGTPVVLVLLTGRPCGSPAVHEQCAAVLLAWLPGAEGAAAIAETLLGKSNPGGKLPISYPRSSGQIPVFYGHKVSGGRSYWKGDYADGPVAPLYPFGHGLSYTRFEVADAVVRELEVSVPDTVTVDVTVQNTGEREGDEVIQLYVRDLSGSLTRPVLELKGFVRIELPPGGSRRVTFGVPVAQLGFHDRELEYVVEPGAFEFFVGTSSADVVSAGIANVVADASGAAAEKAFSGWVNVE